MKKVIQDCQLKPDSHLGCESTDLAPIQKDVNNMLEEARINKSKAACYFAASIPGNTLSGSIPSSFLDLAVGGFTSLVMPDCCK